jgi:tetratricopeptide (TPR) repeat protein
VARGEYQEAVGLFVEALGGLEAAEGSESLPVARLLNEMGVACKFAGRFDEAEVSYRRAIGLVERLEGFECDDMANLLHNVGGLAHSRHLYADGLTPAREGLALRERLFGPNDVAVAADAAALAALLEGTGDYAEAEGLYARAVEILDAAGDVREAAMARNGLGSACQELERYDEAEAHYRLALAALEETDGGDHPDLGHVLNNLATLHRRRGEDVEARALLARAHELMLARLGPDHPVTVEIAGNRRRIEATPSPYV